jgi:glycosyltransferase involved in cell wall biosynthesis
MDSALPVKLFDSMAAQRPVIATPRLETKRVLDTYSAGVSSKSDSTDDFADALLTVVRDTALAKQMGERGRRAAVEHFDWRILATSLGNAVLG